MKIKDRKVSEITDYDALIISEESLLEGTTNKLISNTLRIGWDQINAPVIKKPIPRYIQHSTNYTIVNGPAIFVKN